MADANLALLSLGATAVAIRTVDPTYVASRAIDNNHSTQWWAGSGPTTGCWLTIDLGAVYQVNSHRYNVTGNSANFCANLYTIESSDTNNGSDWVARYTSPNVFSASNPTDFTSNPTHVIPMDTPAAARYWRYFCVEGGGSDNGGWSVYDFELWGSAVAPAVPITLPLLTNSSTLTPPSLAVAAAQALTLPKYTGSSTLRAPTILPNASIILPILAGAPVLRPPILAGAGNLALPLLANSPSLYSPTVVPPFQPVLDLPQLVGSSTLRPPTMKPPAMDMALPHVVEVGILRPPSLVGFNFPIELPWLVEDSILHLLEVIPQEMPIMVEASHGYWGAIEPGPSHYFFGQSIQVVAHFHDPTGAPVDPLTARIQIKSPDGVFTEFVWNVDPLVQEVGPGWYRMRVAGDQAGRWKFRWTATSAQGNSTPAGEGVFIVRRTNFTP